MNISKFKDTDVTDEEIDALENALSVLEDIRDRSYSLDYYAGEAITAIQQLLENATFAE